MKTTKEISLEQVTVGTELGADLHGSNSALILPVGTVLSRAVLDKLKARGVKSICVVVEESLSNEEREALRQQVDEQLSYRFRKLDDQLLMQELKRILLSHRLKDIQ